MAKKFPFAGLARLLPAAQGRGAPGLGAAAGREVRCFLRAVPELGSDSASCAGHEDWAAV